MKTKRAWICFREKNLHCVLQFLVNVLIYRMLSIYIGVGLAVMRNAIDFFSHSSVQLSIVLTTGFEEVVLQQICMLFLQLVLRRSFFGETVSHSCNWSSNYSCPHSSVQMSLSLTTVFYSFCCLSFLQLSAVSHSCICLSTFLLSFILTSISRFFKTPILLIVSHSITVSDYFHCLRFLQLSLILIKNL